MDLTPLLVGVAITAGVHIVLFIVSSALAWMYYKRFTRLQASLSRDELRWAESLGREVRDSRRYGGRQDTAAARARWERRQRRRQEQRERQEGGALASLSDAETRVERGDWIEMQPGRQTGGGHTSSSRGDRVVEADQRRAMTP